MSSPFAKKLWLEGFPFKPQLLDFPAFSAVCFGKSETFPYIITSANSLRMVVEELCVQTILPALAEPIQMEMTIEHSESAGCLDFILLYGGKPLNPRSCADPLPWRLIEHVAPGMRHSFNNGQNRVELTMKGWT